MRFVSLKFTLTSLSKYLEQELRKIFQFLVDQVLGLKDTT